MTPAQIALVKDSFVKVLPMKEVAAAAFYERLFTLDPSLKPLFKGDMRAQGQKLMFAIGSVVAALDHLDTVIEGVQSMARRHVGYGVKDTHYATVGTALLDTLASAFGDSFTPDLHDAWATAYGILSRAMIEAANNPAQAA
ncbi:MAG: globin family protein [Ferrovibrio sp.]|uniref:globin family protein n=1 Tax=Ferrovibrio sp. TaxID=1917215 RepID=UPI003919A451